MRTTFKAHERAGGISLIKVNIRLFIWCACLFLFFFTIVIYRALLEGRWQSLEADAYTWGVCKVRYELGLGENTLCPESKFPHPVNYGGTVVHYIVATSLGTLSFLAFATTKNVYYFWYYAVGMAYKREWAKLRELLTNEKNLANLRRNDQRNSIKQLEDISAPSSPKLSETSSTETRLSLELIAPESSEVSETL